MRTRQQAIYIAHPRSSNTATYMDIHMQTIFFAHHVFDHRCHDVQKHLSRSRAHMDRLDLHREAFRQQP
jgi:hypothetical protein